MSVDTAELTKVDSAISGLSSSPPTEKKMGHRRASSSAAGVYNISDLGMSPLSRLADFPCLIPMSSRLAEDGTNLWCRKGGH